ncbi:MAG: T9SS type A sorting domain-containing protein [Saprospiraceae bacterium]
MRALVILLMLCIYTISPAATLHVGPGQTYPALSSAVAAVTPGDTILIHTGTYPGGLFFTNLQGNANQWITIKSAPGATVVFDGGNNAIQLSDPAYLWIRGLIFQHQTGNGVNIDDGGTYATPAHHVVIEDCVFRDMAVSGNNDLLKLSGLDYFEIRTCAFENGAAGGSGIDMVGCHHGLILQNEFESLGSNSIQAKGGTEWVRIEGNFFRDGGQRTLNLGGSTGLQFFRPDTAHFEAANLQVYSNIFVGSTAPIAYVGAVNVVVANNTFYQPGNWVLRILQETVDPDRFLPCGDNSFINNIIWLEDDLNSEVNIGPNTAPETFVFSNNLWFNAADANWSGPNLPVPETNGLLNADPLFATPTNADFSIPSNSPAAGAGLPLTAPAFDFDGNGYAIPPSIGAFEANPVTGLDLVRETLSLRIFPNPTSGVVFLKFGKPLEKSVNVQVFNALGLMVAERSFSIGLEKGEVDLSLLPSGAYWVQIGTGNGGLMLKK